jgi:hypothetical protein
LSGRNFSLRGDFFSFVTQNNQICQTLFYIYSRG